MPDREKVIEELERLSEWLFQQYQVVYDGDAPIYYDAHKTVDDAISLLKEQETKTGHWIFKKQCYDAWTHTCSECGMRITTAANTFANWCWNCGAKMDKPEEQNENTTEG